ncbi:AraC-like DNA-binding protein [Flavobacterium sp. 7E]|nr:AraC-like DNA-binding protein [Flavobacterium sp. 7E]
MKFDTIYLSNDMMKYLLNGQNVKFINRKINSEKANQLFMELIYAINTKNPKTVEFSLKKFVHSLKIYSQKNTEKYCEQNLYDFKDVSNYIEQNICEKFCLDELSKIANINKYGFVKKFKASTGMTPINYILMKKIFASKSLINQNSDITELAYQYNFCDLAHFSKTFKQYIGISPKKFQSNLI